MHSLSFSLSLTYTKMWAVMKLKINVTIRTGKRLPKLLVQSDKKRNTDNVPSLKWAVFWVEEEICYSYPCREYDKLTYSKNICYSELSHMQLLLSSCLPCLFLFNLISCLRLPENFVIDCGWDIKHVIGISQYCRAKSWDWSLWDRLGPISVWLQQQLSF